MGRSGTWAFGIAELETGFLSVIAEEDGRDIVSLVRHESLPSPSALAEQLRAAFGERGRPRKLVVPDGGTAKALRGAGIRETIVVGSAPRLMEALAAIASESDAEDDALDLSMVAAYESAMAGFLAAEPLARRGRFLIEAPALGIANGALAVVEVSGRAGWMLHFSPEDAAIVIAAQRGENDAGFDADTMASFVEPFGEGASREDREASIVAGLGDLEATLVRNRRVGPKRPRSEDYELAAAITQALTEILKSEREGATRIARKIGAGEVTISGPYADRAR